MSDMNMKHKQAKQTKQFTMCQYAVLASLEQEPRAGYDIAQWFAQVTKHFWVVGHSSIYPALADLERRGLVSYTEMTSDQGPMRKVYHITPTGHVALLAWAQEPAADAEVRDEQLLKALCYGFLPPARATELLRGARARHVALKAQYAEVAREAGDDERAARRGGDPQLAAAALGRRLTARRGVGVQDSYIAWCDEAITSLSLAPGEERDISL